MVAVIGMLACACMFDDSELNSQLDDIKNRIEKLQGRIDAMNSQLTAMSYITSGNVITSVTQDSDGKYVITYLDSKNQEKTVVLATMDQMINVPQLGVELDPQNNLYYWTVTVDGETSYLMNNGEKVPVSGYAPKVSVDAEGYWTVNGERLKDANGLPIQANDGESCVFKSVELNENGDLVITQGNGSVITLPVQKVLNLTLSTLINTTVVDIAQPLEVAYDVTGANAEGAMVAVAEAEGVNAAIDREKKVITVTFPEGFESGYMIALANDFAEHTVLRPVFFEKAKSDKIEIRTADELVQFAADVNAGTGAQLMTAMLMNDIDMKDVATWTPIGNGKFIGSVSGGNQHVSTYEGAAFQGTFDGQGYSIKNLKLIADLTADQTAYGLFGILDGATVKNLTIGAPEGDSSELSFHSANGSDVGVIAGALMSSTIENCVNYAPMHARGTGVDNVRATMGAFAGFVYADEEKGGSVLKDLVNYGTITAEGDKNTKNGATSVMAAGIAGITNGTTNITTVRNYVVNCINYGDMTSSVPRTSGIIAAVNQFTDVERCKNYGNQVNSNAGTRVGMITATMSNYTTLKDCENHGDAIMTGGSSAQVGGLVCLLNSTSCSISGGGNYGNIIGDIAAAQTGYKGLLVANFSKFEKVENVVAGGGIGTYNGGNYVMETVTSDNYMTYIGKYSSANAAKITNIIFNGPAEETPGISTAQDLVDFAAAVNSGASIEKWQAKDGGVNLLANIDLSSVENWVPIGNAVCVPGAADPVITGNAWTGVFDGNGRKISGLKMVAAGTEDGANYGLFGVLAPGALVQNFIIDSSCSLEVTSSAVTASGVVAGYVYDATVRDVTSYAPMTFKGTAGDKKFMSMALVGQVYCEKEGVVMDSCHNYGEIVAENTVNLQAGATAYHIAGLVGFAHALSGAPVMTTISDCSNYGNMTSATARTSGIVAACNRNIQLSNCINHGDQLNTFPKQGGGRLGNITCNITAGCSMTGCINYGDLISTTGARSGGIASLTNTAVFENCANYGEIISDDANRGLFWGYNGSTATWKNCTAGGKVGTYNGGTYAYDSYTEEEKVKYLGVQKSGVDNVLENITYLVGTTEPVAGEGEAELSILFIGNSFTKDAVEHLPGLLKAAGLDKVQLTHMYYGGRLVSEYYAGWSTSSDYKCYECGPGATTWTESTGKTLEQVAASRSWDIITIQEHTGNAAAWTWNSTAQTNLQGMINSAKATQTGAMPKFYYIMSQAYFNMGKIGSGSQPYMTWTDQAGMWDVIAAFGKNVMDNVSFDGIISTGVMLQNLRTSPLDNEMNLTRDGYHMDNGISRYGAACTVFETLITPKYGIKLDNNSYRYAVENTSTSAYCTPVTDANAPVALKAARYAIENPYEVTDMSDVKEDLPGNSIGDVDYEEGSKE